MSPECNHPSFIVSSVAFECQQVALLALLVGLGSLENNVGGDGNVDVLQRRIGIAEGNDGDVDVAALPDGLAGLSLDSGSAG